jgi:uncharacterized protein (DUF1501 family)
MLTFTGASRDRYCDGLTRRNFLRLGALGVGGPALADVLRGQAAAATGAATGARPKSVIYIVLSGGPSHIDMWDLKPHAPAEYRGPFHPIDTALPGVQICEHMPRQAAMMDRLALVRGIQSVENDHFLSEVYTGLPRAAGPRPAWGSIVSRLAGNTSAMPTYASLEERLGEYERPHYAGAGHAPFQPFGESLADLAPAKDLDRLNNRKSLLAAFDNLHREVDRRMNRQMDRQDPFGGVDDFQAQALDIITSASVRDAFDLSREPEGTLARYGHKAGQTTHQVVKSLHYDWDARPFVLARRVVEAGVRVVTLSLGSWDHHGTSQTDIFYSLKLYMRVLDRSLTALFDDLKERGLTDDVLVVVLGEFGRTPKITPLGPGREHWADAGCAVFHGGGLQMGQVIGETDARAERSIDGQVNFQNIIATIYRVLGVDLNVKIPDFSGRPQHLLNDRRPIAEL